jgi:hypothetical protein
VLSATILVITVKGIKLIDNILTLQFDARFDSGVGPILFGAREFELG